MASVTRRTACLRWGSLLSALAASWVVLAQPASRSLRRPLFALSAARGSGSGIGFDQYHEPPGELPPETRTFARLCASLIEEADAINWYEQRLAVEPNDVARAIMTNAVGEEYKHFAMDLEFLLRQKPEWREIARRVLFGEENIVEAGDAAEEAADDDDPTPDTTPLDSDSLGIGSLRGQGW